MFGIGGPPGPFGIPHYTAAKHAVVGLTKMVNGFKLCSRASLTPQQDAKAYSKDGIRINAICPGYVHAL